MLKQEMISQFDPQRIHLGDVVRFSRLGSQKKPRLALVQQVTVERLTVVYCNQQTGKVTYQILSAQDVAVGIYTLQWSHDLHHVYQEGQEEDTEGDLPDLESDLEDDLDEETPLEENDSLSMEEEV